MVIMKNMILDLILVWLLAACIPSVTVKPTQTETLMPTSTLMPTLAPTASPIATHTEIPANSPDLNHLDPSAILFEQTFEAGTTNGLSFQTEKWTIDIDNKGNHSFCNLPGDYYLVVTLGNNLWKNYAVELRVQELEQQEDPYVAVYARYAPETNTGYYGALNFLTYAADLSVNNPYRSFGYQNYPTTTNTWYTLRLEVSGQQINYFINNHLVGNGTDARLSQGNVGFSVSPHLKVCIDDIRVWALTETGAIGQAPTPTSSSLEIVTDKAATGDGGNSWGGHQTRIVRTLDGVFTAYTVDGSGDLDKKWMLAWRQEDGTWPVVAQGDAGREPVNLLASPDGTLHVIGWPNGIGTIWSGKLKGNQVIMTRDTIPGVAQGNWPYNSAGINENGDLCVLSSVGGESPGGAFLWSCFLQSQGRWIPQTSQLDYRYCYTYVFPLPHGQLSLVSTRDVRWGALGYNKPPGEFDYVFNALGYWRTDDISKDPLKQVYFQEEKPTTQIQKVILNAQEDAYLDFAGIMHILYRIQGASTQGISMSRHVALSPSGDILNDIKLPSDLGDFARIFQDKKGRFYILGSSGLLYPAGNDGMTLGTPTKIDLMGYTVDYSGYGISVPRTGTPISNVLDVVFPSNYGKKWIYFQLPLPEK
jgi:hypothetical protein